MAEFRNFLNFSNILSNILQRPNAVHVGVNQQLLGEFPEDIPKTRLYEYYIGWDMIKSSTDVKVQKFMGAGIDITSNNEDFNTFIRKWWKITKSERKVRDAVLSMFITGDFLLERQFSPEGRLSNVEQIPLTDIWKFFRDAFGNETKIQQVVDGIFRDIDPTFYIHHTINNPTRNAFGFSDFHSLAAPRKITGKVDPASGQPLNPERTMMSILDAQATLQNLDIEIKNKISKPKIIVSVNGMPQAQMEKLEAEMEDPNNDRYIWAFNKEAKVSEAQVSPASKFTDVTAAIDEHIDLGTQFASKVITKPGGFGYASSVTTMDVLDERIKGMQDEVAELLLEELIRPIVETWQQDQGFPDFDDMDVKITFKPLVRKLGFEDISNLDPNAVSDLEKRKLYKDLNIQLDDDLWEKSQTMQNEKFEREMTFKFGDPALSMEQPDVNDDRPEPNSTEGFIRTIMKNPLAFEKYVDTMVEAKLSERLEIGKSPDNTDASGDLKGSVNPKPEVTDPDIADKMGIPSDIQDEDQQLVKGIINVTGFQQTKTSKDTKKKKKGGQTRMGKEETQKQ